MKRAITFCSVVRRSVEQSRAQSNQRGGKQQVGKKYVLFLLVLLTAGTSVARAGDVIVTANSLLSALSFAATDNIIVNNGAILTIDQTATIANLQVGVTTNGTVNFAVGPYTLTVTGDVTLGDGTATGTLDMTNVSTLQIGGAFTLNSGFTFTAGAGTIEYHGATQTVTGTNYNHLTISGSSGTKSTGGNLSIAGDLTVSATEFSVGAHDITVSGTTSVTGTLTHASGTGTKIYVGLVTINSGGTWNNSGNANVSSGAGFTVNSASTFTSGSGTYTFTDNAAISGNQPITIQNISVDATKTLTNNQTLTVSTSLVGAGTLTQAANATLNLSGTVTITNLNATANPNTVDYNGGNQTVKATTYHHLTLSGSNQKDAGGAMVINGNFTIGTGVTFNGGAQSVTLSGNFINPAGGYLTADGGIIIFNGTTTITPGTNTNFHDVTIGTGASVSQSGTINVSGSWLDNATTGGTSGFSSTGTVKFVPALNKTETIDGSVAAPAFNHVEIAGADNGSQLGTTQASKGLDINGNIIFTQGVFDAGDHTHTVAGNWTRNGATFTTTGTIVFDGNGPQTIGGTVGTTFSDLTINNSSASDKVDASGSASLTVNALLWIQDGIFKSKSDFFDVQIDAGATLELSGPITVSGDWTNNGTFLAGTHAVTFDGTTTVSGGSTTNFFDVTIAASSSLTGHATLMNVAGNWNNAGTYNHNNGTVAFTSTGTQTLNSGGSSFYGMNHSGTGTLQLVTNDLTVVNTFTNGAGIFDLDGRSWTMTGATFSNDATVKLIGSETITGLTNDVDSGTWVYVGDGDATQDFFTVQDFGATDYFNLNIQAVDNNDVFRMGTGGPAKVIAGTLVVDGGIVDNNGSDVSVTNLTTINGGSYVLTVGGNQTFNGGLTVSSGTFDGTSSTATIDVNGDVIIDIAGTLTAPASGGTFTVAGNWHNTGTFNHNSGTVTFDAASGIQDLTPGGSAFHHVVHSGAGTLRLQNTLSVTGDFLNSDGNFSGNNKDFSVTGTVTVSGGFFAVNGPLSPVQLGGITVHGGIFSGSGFSHIVVNGNVLQNAGTLQASGGSFGSFKVSGDWTRNGGTFNHSNGVIEFNGTTNQIIGGTQTTTFYGLTINNTGTSPNNIVSSTTAVTAQSLLTITAGSFEPATASSFADVSIGSGATFKPASSATITVSGNWVNNGTFTHNSGTVEFTGAVNPQTIGGSQTTGFNNLKINKSSSTQVVEVLSTITTATTTTTGPAGLILTQGIFKLSSGSTLNITSINIPAVATFWLNHVGASTVAGAGSYTVGGTLRISVGTLNVGTGNTNNISYQTGSTLIFEGGITNVASKLAGTSGTQTTTFTMSGGVLNLTTVGSTATTVYPFDLEATGSSFTMSGGTIVVRHEGGGGSNDLGYRNLATTTNVTGGTIQFGDGSTAAGQTMQIYSTAPFFNLSVGSANATAKLQTSGITVLNDISITSGTLDANGLNISVAGNWTNSGTFTAGTTPGTQTVTFNGTAAQSISGTNTFNNLTINNSSASDKVDASGSASLTVNALLRIQDGIFKSKSDFFDVQIDAGTTLELSGPVTVSGNWTNNGTLDYGTGFKVTFDGSTAQTLATGGDGTGKRFWDFEVNKTAETATLAGALGVDHDFTLTAGGLSTGSNFAVDVNGHMTFTTGTFTANGSAITVGGDWTNNGGTLTAGTSTVTLDGAAAQTIGGSTATSFYNLTIANTAAAVAVNVNTNVAGTLTLNGAATVFNPAASVVLNSGGAGTSTLTGTGTVRVTRATGTSDFDGQYVFNTYALTSLTVDYAGTGQGLSNRTYGTLKVSGSLTNNTVDATVGTSLNVTGTFTSTGGTMTMNNGASITNSGTLTFFNLAIAAGATVTTSSSFTIAGELSTGNASSNFNASSGGTMTMPEGASINNSVGGTVTFNNLTVAAGSGTEVTSTGNVAVNGTLNVSAATLTPDAASVISGSGTLTGNGTVKVTRTASTPDFDSQYTIANKTLTNLAVEYAGTGQVLSNRTYGNLTISGSITSGTNTASVDRTFRVASGATFTPTGGTITMSSADWAIVNEGTLTFFNLTIDATPTNQPAVNTFSFSLVGALTVNPGVTLNVSSGTITTTGGSSSIVTSGAAVSLFNLTVSGATSQTGNLTVNGMFDLAGTYAIATNTLTLNNGVTLSGGSISSAAAGTVKYAQSTNGQNVAASFYGNLEFSGGTKVLPSTGTVSIAGTFTTNLTTGHTITNSTIDYNGTGAQTIRAFDYHHLTISGARGGNNITFESGIVGIFGDLTITATGVGAYVVTNNTVDYKSGNQSLVPFTYGNLTLSGSGTKTASGPLTVSNTLTIGSGITLADGGNTITVNGDITNNGSHTGAGRILLAGGSMDHSLSGTGTYQNLELQCSGGYNAVLSGNDLTINGTLTFTSGNIITGSQAVVIGSAGSITRPGTGHVYGSVKKLLTTGAQNFTFVIGDATNYAPVAVSIANVSVAGSLTAKTTASEHPNIATAGINAARNVNRYWTLTSGGGLTVSTYDAVFTFVAGDVDAGANTANFVARLYDGSAWNLLTVGTRTATSTEVTGATAFHDVAIGEQTAATQIALTSGNNQSGIINTALTNPLVVTVRDGVNLPVPGVSVTFAIATTPASATGQSLTITSATTNVSGEASTVLTLGNKVGTYTVTATSGSLTGSPVTFTATATASGAANIALTSGSGQSAVISTSLGNPFVVTVTDAGGNPVAGTTVNFAISAAPAGATGQSLTVTSTTTAGNGQASTVLTLGNKVGTYTVQASSGTLTGSPVSFTATALAGAPASIQLTSGDGQAGMINTPLGNPFVVTVRDAGANPVPGVAVTFSLVSVPPGTLGGGLVNINGTTNANGQASATLVLGSKVGPYSVQATLAGVSGSPVSFNATATAGLAMFLVKTSGDNQTGNAGQPLGNPFVVTVTDVGGNPVSGISVRFAIETTPTGATGQTLSVAAATTNTNGEASTILTLGNLGGTYTVTATSAGLSGSPATFRATASAPTGMMSPEVVPTEFQLSQNYPNPFNPATKIRFGLPEESRVSVEVYNMLGLMVARLVSQELRAGYHEIVWQADDFSSGAYVLRMSAESVSSTRKFSSSKRIVLLK